MKTCILIQGPIYAEILPELFETYSKCKYKKYLSTWDTVESKYINECKKQGFEVLTQSLPEYQSQANLQIKSLGLIINKAIIDGYTHGFRIRADVKINDINKLIKILEDCPENKLSFLTCYQNDFNMKEYLTDQFIFGNLLNLKNYFNIYQTPNDTRFPEIYLMETYFNKINITYESIKNEINLFQEKCYKNNIVLEYTKPFSKDQGNLVLRYYLFNKHPNSIKEWNNLNNL